MTIDIVSLQASTITELRKRVAAAEQETKDWQARHQGVVQLWEALQASHAELQHDYRRLQTAHQEILLAHGQLLLVQARSTNDISRPLTTNTPAQGDSGIEFTDTNLCTRVGCPTTPPHRHITPPPPLNDQAGVDHPSPAPISVEYPPDLSTTISSQEPTLEETIQQRRARIQATLDDQASGAENDDFPTKANPNITRITAQEACDLIQAGHGHRVLLSKGKPVPDETLDHSKPEKLTDPISDDRDFSDFSAKERMTRKFADASGEAGPHVSDYTREEFETDGSGGQCMPGSDETRNSPEKSTEDR